MRKFILTLLFFLNIGAIIALWWLGSGVFFSAPPSGPLIALGRLAGLLAEFFILLEIVLVSRVPLVEQTYGFDTLNRWHRTIGYWLVGTVILHPIFLTFGYASDHEASFVSQFLDFFFNWEDVSKAILGIALLIGAGIVSIPWIRKKLSYESWHGTHLLMYLAIALFFGHQINTGDVSFGPALAYWLTLNVIGFGSIVAYRFLRPLLMFARHWFVVESVVQETHNVFSVVIGGKGMDQFRFRPGQFLQVIFFDKRMWTPHPFSFSAPPNGRTIRISAKAAGDFTSEMKHLLPGTPVLIDGPLGRFTSDRARTESSILLIAGGIGITPIRSLFEEFIREGRTVDLIYGARAAHDFAFKKELDALATKNARVHYLPSDTHGVISADLITGIAPDVALRDVYICGPGPMMKSAVEILLGLGVPKSAIFYEKFQLA